jgi:hypothetical protein
VLGTTCGDFAWLRGQLGSIADCLLVLTHLIEHTLGDSLVLLLRLALICAAFCPVGRWPWTLLLVLGLWCCSICIFNHRTPFLSTVNCNINRWGHQNLQLIFRSCPLFDDCDFDGACVALVSDFTTATSAFFLLASALTNVDILWVRCGRLLPRTLVWCFHITKRALKSAAKVRITNLRTFGVLGIMIGSLLSWVFYLRLFPRLSLTSISFYLIFWIASVLHLILVLLRIIDSWTCGTNVTDIEIILVRSLETISVTLIGASTEASRSALRLEGGRVYIFAPTALALTRSERNLRDRRDLVHRLLVTISLVECHLSAMNVSLDTSLSTINTVNGTILGTIQGWIVVFLARIRDGRHSIGQTAPKSGNSDRSWNWESCRKLPRFDRIVGLTIWRSATIKKLGPSPLVTQRWENSVQIPVSFGITLWAIPVSELMAELVTATQCEMVLILRRSE